MSACENAPIQLSGLDLARRFYHDAVAPIATRVLGPDGEFAAAPIGPHPVLRTLR